MSQPLVLAIEPDLRQAAIVKRIVREKALADVVVVDSLDAAIQAMRTSMPDVLLLSALLSPRDEDDLISHLKTLEHAGHLQTHTIPQLASSLGSGEERSSKGLLSAFRRKKEAAPVGGCDPDLFAEEIRSYLTRAAEKKRELQNMTFAQVASRPDPAKPAPPETTASETTEDSAALSSAWSSPFEWKPASASKRSSRKSEDARAHPAAPPPSPEPVVTAPVVEPVSVIKPAVEEPGVVSPAAADTFVAAPVVTESVFVAPVVAEPIVPEPIVAEPIVAAPVVPEPVIAAPAAAAPIVAEPVVVAPIAATPVVEPPKEIVEPVRKASAKHADTPGPKAVADRPPKLTGRAQLRDLLIKQATADVRGHDRLGPLARWARTDAPRGAKGPGVTSEDVRSLISSLAVPAAVASVTYPRGVRIRRVRVPLAADHEAGVQASA